MLKNSLSLCESPLIGLVLQVNPDDGAVAEGIGVFELPGVIPDDLGAADDGSSGQFIKSLLDELTEFFFGNGGDSGAAMAVL